jgi:uncharacterized protein (TIGR02246 family)
MRTLVLLAVCCGALLPGKAFAQADLKPEAAIRAAIDSYVDAYNRGDVDAVLSHWADDAEYLLSTGQRVQGRDALRNVFTDALAEETRAAIEVPNSHVRVLSDTVATEEGVARIVRPGEPAEETSYLAIYVKQGDAWKLTTVRETEVAPTPVSAAAEQLQQLEWLVGEWTDESDSAKVSSSVRWSGNNAFLVYAFKAEAQGVDALEGTQVIGWDPIRGVIRSWIFDSDGGFGEGEWVKDNDRWVVNVEQTLPDGRIARATNVYTVAEDSKYTWHSFNRSIDGESMPNIDDVTIVRAAAAKEAPTDAPPAPAAEAPQTK